MNSLYQLTLIPLIFVVCFTTTYSFMFFMDDIRIMIQLSRSHGLFRPRPNEWWLREVFNLKRASQWQEAKRIFWPW